MVMTFSRTRLPGSTVATTVPSSRNISAVAGTCTEPLRAGECEMHLGIVAGLDQALAIVGLELQELGAAGADDRIGAGGQGRGEIAARHIPAP